MIFTPALPMYILIPIFAAILAAVIYGFVRTSRQGNKQIVRNIVRVFAISLLCLAVVRPAIPAIAEVEKLGTNLDIYFVLDTTASMGAEDVMSDEGSISRLEAVKDQIIKVAEDNIGAKYSLITFDTTAKVEIPLVRDLSALKSTLEILTPQLFIEGLSKGSNTMMVAPVLENVLTKSTEHSPERVKVVYYITDGEDTDYDTGTDEYDLSVAATMSDERYVIGVGTEEGSDIPLYTFDETFTEVVQDGYYNGQSAMSPEQIQFIADSFEAEEFFLDNVTTQSFPQIQSKTIEEKLKLVDKKSPAQFEFYWGLSLAGGILLIIDMSSLYPQLYRLTRRKTY